MCVCVFLCIFVCLLLSFTLSHFSVCERETAQNERIEKAEDGGETINR